MTVICGRSMVRSTERLKVCKYLGVFEDSTDVAWTMMCVKDSETTRVKKKKQNNWGQKTKKLQKHRYEYEMLYVRMLK